MDTSTIPLGKSSTWDIVRAIVEATLEYIDKGFGMHRREESKVVDEEKAIVREGRHVT